MIDTAAALIGLRAAVLSCAALLFGSALLLTIYWDTLAAALSAKLMPVQKVAAAVLAVATPLMLIVLTSQAMEEWASGFDPATLTSFALNTRGGQVMLVRIALAFAILLHQWSGSGGSRSQCRFLAVWSGLYAATFAFTGHAIMHEGLKGFLHQINHALHILSGLFWVGALLPLLLAAREAAKTAPAMRPPSLEMLARFSLAGALAVTTIAATGVLNTYLILGKVPDDTTSMYQRLLMMKISIIAVMLLLALANRLWLVPRARAAQNTVALQASIAAECIAGFIVIILVSAFGTMEPV